MSFDANHNGRASRKEELRPSKPRGNRLVHKTDIVYREYYHNALVHRKSRKFAH